MRKTPVLPLSLVLALTAVLALTIDGPEPVEEATDIEPTVLSAAVQPSEDGPVFVYGTATDTESFSGEAEWIEVAMDSYMSTSTTTTQVQRSSPGATASPPAPTTTLAPPATTTTANLELRAIYEAEFFARINSFRASNGDPALIRHSSLDARARDWAKHVAAAGKLSHSNIADLLPPWTAAGENLAFGGEVSAVFSSLVNSSYHSTIMLDGFTHVGVGVWVDGDGLIWTVHVFTRA